MQAPAAVLGTRAKSIPTLVDSIHKRLPGLVKAMDPAFVSERIDQQLLGAGSSVESLDVGKVWLREDGTCSLSYQLRLVTAGGETSEHTVLGRVLRSDEAAAEYVRHRVRRMTEMRSGSFGPWQESAAVAAESGLALHPFPIDPALPTLIPATNPSVVRNLVKFAGIDELPVAETVHHPREGACVLRYRFPSDASTPLERSMLYGKVYGDDSGDAIARNLKALTRGPDGKPLDGPVRFPRPLVYSASLRLLITEALPGEAAVPALLKSILTDVPPQSRKENKARTDALRNAVRVSAEALAVLHSTTAPGVGALDVGRPRRACAASSTSSARSGRRSPTTCADASTACSGTPPRCRTWCSRTATSPRRRCSSTATRPRSSTSTPCAGPTRRSTSVATSRTSTCSRRS